MSESYPNEFYRGISAKGFIVDGCYVDKQAFHFDPFDASRGDDFRELSINWNDDEGSLKNLLNQKKPFKDEPQFKGGYCKFNRLTFRAAMNVYFDEHTMSYERRRVKASVEEDIQENPYHGNILVSKNLSKARISMIETTMATLAGRVYPREEDGVESN